MDFRVKLRTLANPEDGLRAIAEHAPQAEALAQTWLERTRPVWSWLYESRRRLATLGVSALTAWMLVHVMFGPNGMVIYRQKRAEYKQLQSENEHLKTENHQYEQQNRALRSDPKTIEKVARESMGYARAGEVVYVPPAPADPAKPAVNTASK